MPDRTLLLAVALSAAVLAGCTGLLPDAFRVAPDPLDAWEAPDCPAVEEEARLAAWRAGIRRMGYRPCAEVPRDVERVVEVPGINTGEHTAAKASAVPLDGTWLVPGDTGTLHRFSADGEALWNASAHPSKRGFHGTPAVHDGAAYVGAYDGALYAFDLATGEEVWRTELGGSIGSSPAYHDGKVYVSVETPTPSGLVSVVDAATGEEVLRDERITDHPHSSVAVAPQADRYVVGANDGVLYAWNLSTDAFEWRFETGDAVKGPILAWDGAAFLGSWDDRVYRVDLETGEEEWSHETGGQVMSGPAVDPVSGTVFASSFDDNAWALDAEDGSLRWRSPIGGSGLSSPVVADGLVLVGSYDEALHALDVTDGREVWRHQADGRVTSSAALADGQVAFTTRADEDPGRFVVLGGGSRR